MVRSIFTVKGSMKAYDGPNSLIGPNHFCAGLSHSLTERRGIRSVDGCCSPAAGPGGARRARRPFGLLRVRSRGFRHCRRDGDDAGRMHQYTAQKAAGGAATTSSRCGTPPDTVVSIADLTAREHGVGLSRAAPGSTDVPGSAGLAVAAGLVAGGRFTVPLHAVLPLERGAEAPELSATGHARGKIVLTVPLRCVIGWRRRA